jgi:aspartyl protease family protein
MKHIVCALICLAGVTSIASLTHAQEVDGCFFLDSQGTPVNLSNLCPESQREKNSRQKTVLEEGAFLVPIERRVYGTPVINVLFDGKYQFEMLLDTGATITVITPQMAETLGIEPEGIMLINTASANTVPMPRGRIKKLEAGGAVNNNITVTISPSLDLGLLGQNFYGEYDISIKKDVVEFRHR